MKNFSMKHVMMATLTLLAICFVGCADEPSYEPLNTTIEATTLALPLEGGEATLDLTANREWSISEDAEWLTVDPEKGSGDQTITFTALANEGGERTVDVTITVATETHTIKVTQAGEGNTGGGSVATDGVTFDGSELPTAYEPESHLTVNGVTFVASFVANFSSKYETQGPIQFGKGGSYLANTVAIEDLSQVVITLNPVGTPYLNFEVFAGTAANPTGTAIEPNKVGDVCTYTIPEGSNFVSIQNNSGYTAYAGEIKFVTGEVSGDGGSTGGDGGTVTPPAPVDGITFNGSELPTAYGEDATVTVAGMEFVANMVANFSSKYETEGPIQFKKGGSYLYNKAAISNLTQVVITLNPVETPYNNFTVFGGSAASPTEGAATLEKVGDVCTYTLPAGSTFFSIRNDSGYTAYAGTIVVVTSK